MLHTSALCFLSSRLSSTPSRLFVSHPIHHSSLLTNHPLTYVLFSLRLAEVELQQKEQELEVQMLRIKNLKEKLLKENQGA